MTLKKLKKEWKTEVLDLILALAVTLLFYWSYTHFQPPIENLFLPIFFVLVLILLKIPKKK